MALQCNWFEHGTCHDEANCRCDHVQQEVIAVHFPSHTLQYRSKGSLSELQCRAGCLQTISALAGLSIPISAVAELSICHNGATLTASPMNWSERHISTIVPHLERFVWHETGRPRLLCWCLQQMTHYLHARVNADGRCTTLRVIGTVRTIT